MPRSDNESRDLTPAGAIVDVRPTPATAAEIVVVLAGLIAIALAATFPLILHLTTHLPNGFFMNWFGALPAGQEGFEYHLVVIALAAVVMLKGSGALSADRALTAPR